MIKHNIGEKTCHIRKIWRMFAAIGGEARRGYRIYLQKLKVQGSELYRNQISQRSSRWITLDEMIRSIIFEFFLKRNTQAKSHQRKKLQTEKKWREGTKTRIHHATNTHGLEPPALGKVPAPFTRKSLPRRVQRKP